MKRTIHWKPARPVRARVVRGMVILACLGLVFFCGVVAGVRGWPPASLIEEGRALVETGLGKPGKHPGGLLYGLTTSRYSYFALDEHGNMALKGSLPYRAERTYTFRRVIDPARHAVVVMDPWTYEATGRLGSSFRGVLEAKVIPLVRQALRRGHPVIVLTVTPGLKAYNPRIHPALEALAAQGEITRLFHEDYDDDRFAGYLRARGIEALIYTGFASNMCVQGRRMGMIPMGHHGFKVYFVPEASAAVEYAETWGAGSVHEASTGIISQGIAEIVSYDDFMKARPAKRSW
jgi:nicotinamidase-related amidase